MMSVILRFPQERLAIFSVSFGAAAMSRHAVVGAQAGCPITITPPTNG